MRFRWQFERIKECADFLIAFDARHLAYAIDALVISSETRIRNAFGHYQAIGQRDRMVDVVRRLVRCRRYDAPETSAGASPSACAAHSGKPPDADICGMGIAGLQPGSDQLISGRSGGRTMSPVYKALTLLGFIVLALAGFFILPFMHACLWFVFLGAIFPVSVNFIGAAVDGTKLTEQGLLDIYKTSLSALPELLRLLMKPFDQGGKPPPDQPKAPDNTPPADHTKVPDKE